MDCEQLLVDLTSLCDSNITCRWGGEMNLSSPCRKQSLTTYPLPTCRSAVD